MSLLPLVLDAVVEGAWLAVVYLVVQVLWLHAEVTLGPLELAVFAGIGIVVSRHRLSGVDPTAVVVGVAVAAGIAGWLLSPAARATLAAAGLPGALAVNPGGWLATAAVLRGAAHGDPANDDIVVTRVLTFGLPGLAVPWILSGFATPVARAAFTEPAFVATVTFVATALLAIAVARLQALDVTTGLDWRANRPWLAVLVAIILGMVAITVPLAFVVGIPIEAAIWGALGPIGILATAGTFVVTIYTGLVAWLVTSVFGAVMGALGIEPPTQIPPTAPPSLPENLPQGDASASQPVLEAVLVAAMVIAAVVAVVVIVVLIARWLRPQLPVSRLLVSEERAIVIPEDAVHIAMPRSPWRRARHPEPRDAVGAYLALLRALRDRPAASRAEPETPAAHASRLRRSGAGGLPLDLLAADYELARYGERALTPAENRRALARWRELIGRLRG